MEAAAAGGESDRYVGALVLMVLIGIVIGLRIIFFSGSDDQPAPVPSPPPAVTYHATTPTSAPLGE